MQDYGYRIRFHKMKSSFSPLKCLGLAVLIFIAWHLHPRLAHICHEKVCPPVIASAKAGVYLHDTRVFAENCPVDTGFRLAWLINIEERAEELEGLYKLTPCQARAPPQKSNFMSSLNDSVGDMV